MFLLSLLWLLLLCWDVAFKPPLVSNFGEQNITLVCARRIILNIYSSIFALSAISFLLSEKAFYPQHAKKLATESLSYPNNTYVLK